MTPSEGTALAQRIERIVAPYARTGSPGCAVGVQRGGERLFAGGFGLASVELGVPIDARTVFRIASVTKQFTVAALLLLAAQGRLRLSDDVRTHLPELAGWPHAITLDQLARNVSGLPDFLELLRLGGLGLDARFDRAAMLRVIAGCRQLNFAPGSRFLYCNSNFLLLGRVVERVAGCALGEFLKRQVFDPLGMGDTALVVGADEVVPRLATPYLPDGAGGVRRALHGFEHGGEGGLVSCVEDLLLWLAELMRPRRLPAGLLDQLGSPTTLAGGTRSPYARGLEHSRWHGLDLIGHGGLWPGYRTEVLLVPGAELAVAVISNHGGSNPYRLAREVVDAALDRPRAVPVGQPAATPPEVLAGAWWNAELPALFDLAVQGGELVATQWGVPFALTGDGAGGWQPLRGAYEFGLRAPDAQTLLLDVGAGDVARCVRLAEREPPPADLAGSYRCDAIGTTWHIEPPAADAADDWPLRLSGPHRVDAVWTLRGAGPDLVEVIGPSYWMTTSQLARVERDASGRIAALCVHSSRVRGLRFVRQGGLGAAGAACRES